ncbi:MAG: DUF971 domain-containing protein [Gammaproteobacteria bacterium]|nr:DUF971 domain-containing protein [Gammaproteobacteria bacterium]NIR82630.1 DUF971 domain-containing protein [Gammaproteobacteria bacterium]NIR89093.1 DUF971 domain-containing protein [Gammaproteobacteria bacterium]NIU03789.1 DUF971 domain-containing protein [Gammaproteobacteria bacterium]NIV51126.1 DUF971 domain-containing protein [Gammaproteobacteria bacterium]
MQPTELNLRPRSLVLYWSDHRESEFHYIWLRDNCRCPECLHPVTFERSLLTAAIPREVAPDEARIEADGSLYVRWPGEGHESRYPAQWLRGHCYSAQARAERRRRPRLWDARLADDLPAMAHSAVVGSDEGLLRFLEMFRDYGFTLVRGVPTVPGEVARFADHVAYVREIIFGRVHDVLNLPDAYNVAQTAIELRPHTDLPSYGWPPSVQLIHCLMNQAQGGESIVVDGFQIASRLREEDPDAFAVLTRVGVQFRLYASDGDTLARAPMIQLDTEGELQIFRFSNQLIQPLDIPGEWVEPFYDAYRKLSLMVLDARNQVRFRLASGDMIVAHGHRVMHGRAAFDPSSGRRHLQDAYMEFDDFLGRIRLLRGKLYGEGAVPGESAKRRSKRGDGRTQAASAG